MKKYLVIGNPIGHSLSPRLHNHWLKENNISAVYEKDKSIKIGNYVPGTKIPIVSDKYLKNINKKLPIINLAWHIDKEIKSYLKKNKINNDVVDILNSRDFI